MESSDGESPEPAPPAHNHDGPICHHPPDEINGPHSPPSSLVPPYWSHQRYESYSSVQASKPPPITLEDHTEEPSEQSGAVWARSVTVDDHVLVSGAVPSVGSFVVWNCRIDTLQVGLRLPPARLSLMGFWVSASYGVECASGWLADGS